jgi:hypothetical protein
MVADSVPNAPGLNVTIMVHALPAPKVVVQVPPVTEKSAAFVPLKLSLRVTVRVWWLVTLKDSAGLRPNFTLPNIRLLFDSVRPAAPAPESVECCGLVVALSKIISVAPCGPSAVGVNATPSVQVVLGATVIGIAPHVPMPLRAYSAESDDVALPMISEWVAPVLSTVRFLVSVCPRATLPNASDAVTDTVVVGVAVGVPVATKVAVAVDVAVWVAVAVAVDVIAAVAVAVFVPVAVGVAVLVGVRVEELVGVVVTVGVRVAEAVAVGVAVLVAVGVGEGVPPVPNAITLAE